MNALFEVCHNLTNLDLTFFNIKNIKDMGPMLEVYLRLKNLDLSSFNTNKIINMLKINDSKKCNIKFI